jgi:hypothetical protein
MLEGIVRKFGEQEQLFALTQSLTSIKTGSKQPSPPREQMPLLPMEPLSKGSTSSTVDQFLQIFMTDFNTGMPEDNSIFLEFNEQ